MIEKDYEFKKIESFREIAIKQKIYSEENIRKYECCPHCGCAIFIKYGKYQGIQRYRCKNENCKKTFSNTTNSIWKYLKHKPDKWFKFIELMGESRTLIECARKLKISIVTAFNWRHKILHAIENNNSPESFNKFVSIKTYYTEKCYKGSRNKNYTYKDKIKNKIDKMYGKIPRDICVLIAQEGRNLPLIKSKRIDENLESNLKENVLHIVDKNCYIHPNNSKEVGRIEDIIKHNIGLSVEIKKKYGFKIRFNHMEDNVKEDHKNKNFIAYLAVWISRFKGIATKYVDHYYNFYSIIDSEKNFDYMNIFFELLKKGFYTSVQEIRSTHLENY